MKKAEIVSTTLAETVKQLRKQLKEHAERYRNDVTTVYVTCDKESQRSQMEMEDALSNLHSAKLMLGERDERIIVLERIKAQKGELEVKYSQA